VFYPWCDVPDGQYSFSKHVKGDATMRMFIAVIGLALAIGLTALPERAQAAGGSTDVPISITVFIPCANNGAGETVTLTGNLHIETNITFNNAGGGSIHLLFNPQGISGTGSVTGAKYQGTGMTQEQESFSTGFEFTFVNRFDIIGQGPGNNFSVHETAHITVNANGTLTVFFDNISVVCK
jgi:hypothetical protein